MDLSHLYSLVSRVSKPGQYLGNEVNAIHKDFSAAKVRVALVFPDKYEIGMSHVGLKILYDILNKIPDVVAERCFAPDLDMERELRAQGLPLFSLESKRPLKDFDLIGFSLTYELTYTNMVNILELGGVPVWQKDRGLADPLIIAGGGCAMNAEPVADFLDAAVLGDGEEVVLEIVEVIRQAKFKSPRGIFLEKLSNIEGIYVPSFFQPEYNPDGTISRIKPLKEGYAKVNKRVVQNIDSAPYPTAFPVPSIRTVHDRIGIEIQRGCNRACRFCQAGYIDRPVRQRSPETVLKIAEDSLNQTGVGEISLLSLSAADYACLVPTLAELNRRYAGEKVSISVPATRTEKLTPDLIEQIKKVRKTGFTIAPEAGSARMRRVINKGNKVDDLYTAVTNAFSAGWELLKLYYMVGLPFERDEDLLGIADEANESIKICKGYTPRAELNLSLSSFVPKPHTPFQWEPQMTIEETRNAYDRVKRNLRDRRIRLKHHNPEMSFVEGLFSRGDRRVSEAIYLAWKEGCRFDEWEEHFDYPRWQKVFEKWGGDVGFYLHRRREKDEILPWDHLFAQMDKNFLWEELERAHDAALSFPLGAEVESGNPEFVVSSKEMGFKINAVSQSGSPLQKVTQGGDDKRRGLKPLPDQLPGFTEDCSVQRCSDCGVCDFRAVKNRVYVPGKEAVVVKKGHREWYGWKQMDNSPLPPLKPALSEVEGVRGGEGELRNTIFRIHYSKTNEARFIGHLELMDVLKRGFKRLKTPVAYSEGFHPQMKFSMGHPLSVGVESQWEYFDVTLTECLDATFLTDSLNRVLPEGIKVLGAEVIDRNTPSLYSSTLSVCYEASFEGSINWPSETVEKLECFRRSEKFNWRRERAGGVKEIDLKKLVDVDLVNLPQSLIFKTKMDPQGSVKPMEVLSALAGINREELDRIRLKKIGIVWQ